MKFQKEEAKQKIRKLVDKYNKIKIEGGLKKIKEISEADVRADFVDELFLILGWDIKDPDEYNREHYIRGEGFADIALILDKKPIIFIEAKKFRAIHSVSQRKGDWSIEERQVIYYAAGANIKWAILTNFEKLRVFNALNGLTVLNFEALDEYIKRLDELLLLTRDSVVSGRINYLEKREERKDIDLEFLKALNRWRVKLANNIYKNNKDNDVLKNSNNELDLEILKNAVQRILDRLIIIRYAEDKLILDNPVQLKSALDYWLTTKTFTSLIEIITNLFSGFDNIYNSKIFKKGHISEKVKIDDEILCEIINELCDTNFRKFDFDILGNTYETYLGNTLYLKDFETLDLKPSQETRKESGIYYTPPYVVDYIIKNTLGELLKNKKPDEVKKIKVLDPACGSGSFLIKAFDYFLKYYEKENERIKKEKAEKIKEYLKANKNQLNFDSEALKLEEHKGYEKEILKNNIYGVDLDKQAAEIASVNLTLKALKNKEKLPLILGENIKVGNSLIFGNEEELKGYFGENWRKKKPFNWEMEFQEAFDKNFKEEERGFDVVVGNPPYINVANLIDNERNFLMGNYKSAIKRLDIYITFIERGINLLKNGGKLSFIIPYPFLNQNYAEKLRKIILDNCFIEEIVDLSSFKIFSDAMVRNIILILKKESDKAMKYKNRIKIITQEKDPNQDGKICGSIFYIPQQVFHQTPEYMFRLELNEKTIPIIEKIKSNSINLGKILVASWGARGVPVSEFHLDSEVNDLCKKMIKGENISRYSLNYSGKWLLYDTTKLYRPSFPELFESEKLVISEVTGKTGLIATYDDEKYYTDHSLSCCILKHNLKGTDEKVLRKHKLYVDEEEIKLSRKYDLKYILGMINSKLMNFYFKTLLGYALNVYPESIEQLPIFPATSKQQKPFIEPVDKMLTLHKQFYKININFDQYLNLHPRIKDTTLETFMDKLPINNKKVLNNANQIEGKIIDFKISLEGEDWVLFEVKYRRKTTTGKYDEAKIRAFKCKFEDVNLRKFIYYSIKQYVTPGKVGKGNIYEKILKIKLPCFCENEEKDKKIIDKVMNPYLKAVEEKEKLQKEIEEINREINKKVYELYNLTPEEIKIVEEQT